MSETLEDTGGAPAAPEASSAAPEATAAPAAPEASSTVPEVPAAPEPANPIEAAASRARARIDAKNAKNSPAPTPEQAAASADAGASTPTLDEAGQPTDPKAATSEAPAPASTATAPENWPAEYRERFDKLPEEARGIALDFYKEMQGGFTQAMQQVSTQAKALGNLSEAMEKHKVDPVYVSSLMDTAVAFNDDPKATLKRLAQEKGIEVYFEPQPAQGEVPQFETAAEMAAWAAAEATRKAQEVIATERQANEEATRKATSEAAFRAEFKAAADSLPEFAERRPAVLEKLAAYPELSVEDAYWLTTVPDLQKQVSAGAAAIKELAALKAKQAAEQKRITAIPPGHQTGTPAIDESALSPGQRAYNRAAQKRAARQNRASA